MARAEKDVLQVHHVSKLPDGTEKIVRVTPYVIIGGPGGGKVFLKNGHVIDENGEIQDTPPAWLAAELEKLNTSTLADIGFTDRVPSRDTVKKR